LEIYKTGYHFIIYISHYGTTTLLDLDLARSEFDIFAPKPVQNAINDTYEVVYKLLAPSFRSTWSF
jgi:hypothetical protein